MAELLAPKSEVVVAESSGEDSLKRPMASKLVVLADLNVDPPEMDGPDSAPVSVRSSDLTGYPTLFLAHLFPSPSLQYDYSLNMILLILFYLDVLSNCVLINLLFLGFVGLFPWHYLCLGAKKTWPEDMKMEFLNIFKLLLSR